MRPIVELKKDIDFYRSLNSLITVLKLVAASQYQRMEKKLSSYGDFLKVIEDNFSYLDFQKIQHPFVSKSDKLKIVIAVTTDVGFLGGLNALVMTKAISLLDEQSKMVIIGRRGQLYVDDKKLIYANFPAIDDSHRLEQALKLRDYISENFLKGNIGALKIVFPHAVSFTLHVIEVMHLLPFIPDMQKAAGLTQLSEVEFESKFEDMAEYLVYLWLGQKFFEIFGLSAVAEQAARYMHLESCTQRIQEMDVKLKFQYFRARHEIIDQNMRELFAARLING